MQPNSSHLLAGLSDGSLSIRTRIPTKKTATSILSEPIQPSYDAILAGAGGGGVAFEGKEAMEGLSGGRTFAGETKVSKDKKKKLQEWDRLLKDFRYGDALDSVLRKVGRSFFLQVDS